MERKILVVFLEFEESILQKVVVLYSENGINSASICTKTLLFGYCYLKRNDMPTMTLFENVVEHGRPLSRMEEKLYFPNCNFE